MRCIKCNQKINPYLDDFRCIAVRVPIINLRIWRYNCEHHECLEFEGSHNSDKSNHQQENEKETGEARAINSESQPVDTLYSDKEKSE